MSESWLVTPLGEHCSVKARIGWRGLASSEYLADGPFLIAGKHVRDGVISWDSCDHISEYRYRESMEIALEPGDVILTKDGTIGRVARIDHLPGAATLNGTMMLLRPREGLDYRYLFHVLRGKHFKRLIDDKVSGSSIPHIFQRDMVTLPIALPPPEQQQAIANVLDTLDTTIRHTEAIIEKLKQVKQGLLHDLLTRGIDANGELRPLDREAPHLYKDSPLGRIPREWDASKVAAEFNVCSGITLGPHRAPRSNPRKYLRVANVQRGRIDLTDIALLEATDAEMANRGLAPGDLLVVEGHASPEEIGRCAMADEAVRGFTFQNHLFRLRAQRLVPSFALHWMNSSLVRSYWRTEAATSSGLNTINRAKLSRVLVAVPPYAEQQRIVEAIAAADLRQANESLLLTKLNVQKSGLMDDLLTGRVRVTALLGLT